MSTANLQRHRQRQRHRVKLSISASQLKHQGSGLFSSIRGAANCSPFAVVTQLATIGSGEEPHLLGRTESIPNTLHPQWTKIFLLDFELGKEQFIDVSIYDQNVVEDEGDGEGEGEGESNGNGNGEDKSRSKKKKKKKRKKMKMGSAQVEIGRVLGTRRNRLVANISQPCGGRLFVHVAPLEDNDHGHGHDDEVMVQFDLSATLERRVDAYVEIQKREDFHSGMIWTPIYRSDIVTREQYPQWDMCSFQLNEIQQCMRMHKHKRERNDTNEKEAEVGAGAPFRIMVWGHRKRKRHLILGSVETTISAIVKMGEDGNGAVFHLVKGGEMGEPSIVIKSIQFIREGGEVENATNFRRDTIGDKRDVDASSVTSTNLNGDGDGNGDMKNDNPRAISPVPCPPQDVEHLNVESATEANVDAEQELISPVPCPPQDDEHSYVESAIKEEVDVEHEPISPPEPIPVPIPTPSEPSSSSVPIRTKTPTFVDYLCGGCELDLMVAIDYTSSNGDPRIPGTPHYIDKKSRNEYEKAIIAMGDILVRYDSDQKFPVWGFGAKFEGVTRHIFQVGTNSTVMGVQGLLEAYYSSFDRGIMMSSPVILTHVMRVAAKKAHENFEKAHNEGKQSYSILLILTHGCISSSHMEDTMATLREISDAPLSVIIVGIGENDFEPMRALDDFQNEEGGRDICNFVAFDSALDRSVLTRATLNEIPHQLVSYFTQRGIYPMEMNEYDYSASFDSDDSDDRDLVGDYDLTHTFDSDDEVMIADGEKGYKERNYM